MALKWKWNKSQSSKFVRCGTSGVYNFYYFIDERKGCCKAYQVNAFQEMQNGEIKYKLIYVEQEAYQSPTVMKELRIFKTSIEAKKFAEELERK